MIPLIYLIVNFMTRLFNILTRYIIIGVKFDLKPVIKNNISLNNLGVAIHYKHIYMGILLKEIKPRLL